MLLVPDRCWESIILSKEKDAKAGWGKVIVLTGKLKESNDLKQLSQRKPLRKKKKIHTFMECDHIACRSFG